MNKMDDNNHYYPYYRTKNRSKDKHHDNNHKTRYKKNKNHHYQDSTIQYNHRNYSDFSSRNPTRKNYRSQKRQSKSRSFSYFSTSPRPLMSSSVPPLPSTLPPPPLYAAVPHERESWIRSVKKTKIDESVEQKTQYLETMLRMPQQQKSSLNSSRFDRMRFADEQLPLVTATNTNIMDNCSFHLVSDINDHDDLRAFQNILSDNKLQNQEERTNECSNHQTVLPPLSSTIECESTSQKSPKVVPGSGFLIDNCDEEESLPSSTPPRPPLPPSLSGELIQQNEEDDNERRVMLVSELDAADAENKRELKRQKLLHQKLQKKTKETQQLTTKTEAQQEIFTVNDNSNEQESLPNWIIDYDIDGTNQVLQLANEVRRNSTTMTDEDKTAKVNLILMKIQKQQEELRKLKHYIMSMLGEQERSQSLRVNRNDSTLAHDLLMNLLNRPLKSGCWLCSGKMYAEVAIQCNHLNER